MLIHTGFQRLVVELAGNRTIALLSGMLESLYAEAAGRYVLEHETSLTEQKRRRAERAHLRLVDLVHAGDAAGAEVLWRRHLTEIGQGPGPGVGRWRAPSRCCDDQEDGMGGVIAYGAYIPYYRLRRSRIAEVLGSGGGPGSRSVASFDEDTTSMGVEAARAALRMLRRHGVTRRALLRHRRARLPRQDQRERGSMRRCGLTRAALAVDVAGGGALRAGRAPRRPATPASRPWRCSPTSAPAYPAAPTSARAATPPPPSCSAATAPAVPVHRRGPRATRSATGEFLDRWRSPATAASRVWEERFGEHVYVPLATAAFAAALEQAGLTAADVDHLVVAGAARPAP